MDRQGNPLTLDGYLRLLEDNPNYHIVKQEYTNGIRISTVWIGYASLGGNPFETMLFGGPPSIDQSQMRHATEKEALEFHENTVQLFSNPRFLLALTSLETDGRARHGFTRHYRGLIRHARKS